MVIKINDILHNNNIKSYLEKFPQNLVINISRIANKELLNMTLEQIFENKEFYHGKNLENYYHNLKVIKNKDIQENSELKSILNKKYIELFEDYINSKEFKVDEINRLKNHKMEKLYIERYIYLAKHLNEFFSE